MGKKDLCIIPFWIKGDDELVRAENDWILQTEIINIFKSRLTS
jgi:hypothetical protein